MTLYMGRRSIQHHGDLRIERPLTSEKREGARDAYPDKPVLGLELLGRVEIVVDEAESGGLAASEVGAKLEDKDAVGLLHLVNLGQLVLELRLQHQSITRVSLAQRTRREDLAAIVRARKH